ncbi:MAG: sulfotransferase [Candidatus Kerfeldbacteria bacterium]
MNEIIYISGIGRSGSTLLDLVISSSTSVCSVGEMYKFNAMAEEGVPCSCGRAMTVCPFWSDAAANQKQFHIENRMNVRDYLKILHYALNPLYRNLRFAHTSDNAALLSELSGKCTSGVKYFLDSSKEVGRLAELHSDPSLKVTNIFVIRDARAVANSFNSGKQGPRKSYFLSLGKWLLMNFLIMRYVRKSGVPTLFIHYEKFCREPKAHLESIARFLNIEIPADYAERVRTMDDYHNIGGNRLALPERRKAFSGIRCDETWKTEQPLWKRAIAAILIYPIQWFWLRKSTLS